MSTSRRRTERPRRWRMNPHEWSPLDEFDPDAIPDKRLALLFVCAHPAIDPGIRTPLMLQTVLGFDAAQIAAAFAIPDIHDRAAARAGKAPHQGCAHPLRRARPRRHAEPPARRARSDLRRYAIEWLRVSRRDRPRVALADEALYLAIDPGVRSSRRAGSLRAGRADRLSHGAGRMPATVDVSCRSTSRTPRSGMPRSSREGERYLRQRTRARTHRPLSAGGGDPVGAL